jgi:uncharacterized protein (DUF736 family)
MPENTKIGALWTKKTRNGGEFYSGMIELDGKQTRIAVWPTREKKSEKSPDYTINLDTWKPEQATTVAQVAKTFADDLPNF